MNNLMNNLEIFNVIQNYPKYEISNFGNLRNIKTGRILKQFYGSGHGSTYKRVRVRNNGLTKNMSVHRLVALTFIQNNDIFRNQVDHINRDKFDNNVNNLRWVTAKENAGNRARKGAMI